METVFLKLLNMSITAGYLVLILVLLRPLLKKAPKWICCALWGLVGLRLVLPFSIESVLSLIPSAETVPSDIMYSGSPAITSGLPAVNSAVNPVLSQALAPQPLASANPLQIWLFIASGLWLIGISVMLLYALISCVRLRLKMRTAVLLRENIWQSEQAGSPFVFGLIRPKIYLPFDMDEGEMEHVLAHERAHISRRDHWIKPIGFVILAVYWFNPLMWLAYVLLCRDIELACDEHVIASLGTDERKAYSAALLKCSVGRGTIAACPLAFGEVGVKQRVKSILSYKKPAFWIIIAALAACMVLTVCFLTDPAGPDLDIRCEDIASVQLMDLRRSSGAVDETMNSAQIDELASRLQGLKKLRRGDAYGGMTPAYSMTVTLSGGGEILIRGYSLNGTELDLVYGGETYRVADTEFQEYVSRVCSGQDVTQAEPEGVAAAENGVGYTFSHSVYTNPLSSYLAFGTNGCRYVMGDYSFTIVDLETGEVEKSYTGLSWDWQALTQERLDGILFSDDKVELKEFGYIDVSVYEEPLIFSLDGQRHLLDMDGELWLIDGKWHIYALEPESEMYTFIAAADLNHDGEQENILMSGDMGNGYWLWVFDGGNRLLWHDMANISHAGWNSLYLCTLEGNDYILRYNPYMSTGIGYCSYELFWLDGNEKDLGVCTVDSREIEFSTMYPAVMDAAEMTAFADAVNALLEHSALLLSTQDGVLTVGPVPGTDYYESYSFINEYSELYSPDDTLAQCIEKYREYLDLSCEQKDNSVPMVMVNLRYFLMNGEITWEMLRPYIHTDEGSGLYVYVYPIGKRFQLIVSSPYPDTSSGPIDGRITLVALADASEAVYGQDDLMDFLWSKMSYDTSPLIVSGWNSIMAVPKDSHVEPAVLYVDGEHAEKYGAPFSVYIGGESFNGGMYSITDAETGEALDFFNPSGLEANTYLLQNAESGHTYTVTLSYYDERADKQETSVFRIYVS